MWLAKISLLQRTLFLPGDRGNQGSPPEISTLRSRTFHTRREKKKVLQRGKEDVCETYLASKGAEKREMGENTRA